MVRNGNLFILTIVFAISICHDDETFSPNSPFNNMQLRNANTYVHGSNFLSEPTNVTDKELPIVLWWSGQLYPNAQDGDLSLITCGQAQCYSTPERKYLRNQKTRGIIFYGTDISPEDLPLPRSKLHEWAVFHEESPLNNYMLSHGTFIKLFNHTATFRRESDYPVTTQNIYSLEYLVDRKPVPLKKKNRIKKERNLAPVLYVQSHSNVPSDRDRYVKELMKYIRIDSYGKSLHNRDLPESLTNAAESFEKEEFLDFISVYKFHLSFENAICKDYMTEKLMRPLFVGSVPVYRGSPNAKDWMPNNNTIIFVDDFESPKDLADYLNFLDENDNEYEKYLSYKKSGGFTNQFLIDNILNREWGSHDINFHIFNVDDKVDYFKGFECHVCRKINERILREKLHEKDNSIPLLPPRYANSSHMGCQQPYPSLGDPEQLPKNDSWRVNDWIGIYWTDLDRAIAVRQMIEAGEKKSKQFPKYLKKVISKINR